MDFEIELGEWNGRWTIWNFVVVALGLVILQGVFWLKDKFVSWKRGDNLPIDPRIQDVLNIIQKKKDRLINGLGDIESESLLDFGNIRVDLNGRPGVAIGPKSDGRFYSNKDWIFTNKKETKLLQALLKEIFKERQQLQHRNYLKETELV